MMDYKKLSTLLSKFGVITLIAAAVFIVAFTFNIIRQNYDDRSLQAMHPGRQELAAAEDNVSIDLGDTDYKMIETETYNGSIGLSDYRQGTQLDQSDSALDEVDLDDMSESQSEDIDPFSSLSADFTFEKNQFQDLFMRNSDFVGWIKIDQTRIDYPIVKGRDNLFYLDRNFDREQRRNGAIFMDYRNSRTWQDRHTIVYGHHTRDGSMFTDLLKFRQSSFYNQNRDFSVDALFGEVQYRIFAAYIAESEPSYIRTIFDEPAFDVFITEIRNRTLHEWDTDISFGDQLITLITCAYDFNDARMVVHAVRISE